MSLYVNVFLGTPLYLSPELVDGAHYTEKTGEVATHQAACQAGWPNHSTYY